MKIFLIILEHIVAILKPYMAYTLQLKNFKNCIRLQIIANSNISNQINKNVM